MLSLTPMASRCRNTRIRIVAPILVFAARAARAGVFGVMSDRRPLESLCSVESMFPRVLVPLAASLSNQEKEAQRDSAEDH